MCLESCLACSWRRLALLKSSRRCQLLSKGAQGPQKSKNSMLNFSPRLRNTDSPINGALNLNGRTFLFAMATK